MQNGKHEEGYRRLAVEIVLQAVEDWRGLIRARAWLDEKPIPRRNFADIRAFFKGEYCELLLAHTDVKPIDILNLLEEELREAIAEDRPQTLSRYSLRY